MQLNEVVDHIYGRTNVITRLDRPNMFIKELSIYVDYLKNKIEETKISMTKKQEKYLVTFSKNLKEGINYYSSLFSNLKGKFEDSKSKILNDLDIEEKALHLLNMKLQEIVVQDKVIVNTKIK